jgi:hypothetical protein
LLRGALRRIAGILAVVIGLTAAVSLILGALAHASLERALADGFYVAGAVVLIGSFVLGMRGPLRAEWGDADQPPPDPGELPARRGGLMPRAIRKTTPDERTEARRNSLALFVLGIALVFIGAGFDPSRHPF